MGQTNITPGLVKIAKPKCTKTVVVGIFDSKKTVNNVIFGLNYK